MRFLITIYTLTISFQFTVFAQKQKDEPTSYTDDFEFVSEETDSIYQLWAKSKSYAPIEIILTDKPSQQELASLLLPSFDSLMIFQLSGAKLKERAQKVLADSLQIGYYLGHPDLIDPDEDFQYRLPFKKGKKYRVTQSFNGKTSHHSDISRYAIDFQLEIGESVYAARGGLVVKTVDWFTKQGGPELRNAANRILILHEDGTRASYVHLKYKGVLVQEGQRVKKGNRIGISGLTGYTNGPHLHFVVRKERDIAIPVYFEGYADQVLKKGKRYKVKD